MKERFGELPDWDACRQAVDDDEKPHLRRRPCWDPSCWQDGPKFKIGKEYVRARRELDIFLPFELNESTVPEPELPCPENMGGYPPCPDCGGEIRWTAVPWGRGIRRCRQCGSLFQDSRYDGSKARAEIAKLRKLRAEAQE